MKDQYKELISMPLDMVLEKADQIRKENNQNEIETCAVINAKSGKCSEDCKYCAQSSHHKTNVSSYSLKSDEEIFQCAKKAKENNAHMFGIVTSGNAPNDQELNRICEVTKRIISQLDMKVCCSLGAISSEHLLKLKEAGVKRYHHNIETSRSFYSKIVTTHDFEQRVQTVKRVKEVGMQICSGGIIGLGESYEDRIEMALILKELDVDSIPLNVLIAIEGTKLYGIEPLSEKEVLRTIAIFKIILEGKSVRLCAGREQIFKDKQHKAFEAGINGIMVGGYLTVGGGNFDKDHVLIKKVKQIRAQSE